MGTSAKNKGKKKRTIPVVYRPHAALSLLQNGFLSWITFPKISKCRIHLTWLLCLCPVSLIDDRFRGFYSVSSFLSSFTICEGHCTSEILVLVLFVSSTFPLCELSHLIRSVSGVLARCVIYSSPSHWLRSGVHGHHGCFAHPGLFASETKWVQHEEVCTPHSCPAEEGSISKSLIFLVERTSLLSSAGSERGPRSPQLQGFCSHLQCCSLANLAVSPFLSLPSCPHLQVHGGPVDSVLQGDPWEEPVPGHAVVPALLPDLQRLLCKQDAAEELMKLCHSLESSSCLYVNHRLVGLSTGTSWVATAWWIPKHT